MPFKSKAQMRAARRKRRREREEVVTRYARGTKRRKPALAYCEYKFLPVDMSQKGAYHPSAADLIKAGGLTFITIKRYSQVRKRILREVYRQAAEKN